MGTQGLHAALVLIVPDTQGLVISTAHNKSPTRMEQQSTHPVIVTDLRGEKKKMNEERGLTDKSPEFAIRFSRYSKWENSLQCVFEKAVCQYFNQIKYKAVKV